jgi:membrane-associated phospholipid phosphatase
MKIISKTTIDLLYAIGYFSEQIVFLITICLLLKQYIYLFFYIIFFLLINQLTKFLKKYFHEYRPNNPIKFLNSENFSKKIYGMPSNHTTLVFFSIVYLYLIIHKIIPWILLLIIISILTIYERYIFHNHTLKQLFFGAFLGSFIAYLSVLLINIIKIKYNI